MNAKAKRVMETWRVISLDVWGNERDGWDVNNAFRTSQTVAIPQDASEDEIIKVLKREGLIKKGIRRTSIDIEANEDDINVTDARNGRPEFNLERERQDG